MITRMDPGTFALVVVIAVGIGTLASLFGIGGGFLLTPTMILILGFDPKQAVGTIPMAILLMSLSSTIAYARQKRIDVHLTLLVSGSAVFGSVLGALTTTVVTGQFILIMFGLVEIVLALLLATGKGTRDRAKDVIMERDGGTTMVAERWYVLHRTHRDADGHLHAYGANLLFAIPVSFLAGYLSTLLGIGGGTLYIQLFVFLCGMPIHMAIACSMMSIFISSISGFATYAAMGQVNYLVALAYGIGMIAGAQVGSAVNKRIQSRYLKPLAAGMIMIIAVQMIIFALLQ